MWLTPLNDGAEHRFRNPGREQACGNSRPARLTDTDTEALQKKLESAKKAAAAKKEAETADSEATVEQQIQETEEEPKKEYVYPPLSLLKRGGRNSGGYSEQEYRETAVKLQQTLRNFGVGVTVTNISCGLLLPVMSFIRSRGSRSARSWVWPMTSN